MSNDKLQQALEKLPPLLQTELGRNLCSCNEVPTIKVIEAIVNGASTVAEINQQTYAGDGIGCCTLQIEDFLDCLCNHSNQKTP